MKYKIQIEELLQKVVEVEADNRDETFKKVKSDYYNCKIQLDTADLKETVFGIGE